MLVIDGLSVSYGSASALRDVSVSSNNGDVTSVLGSNGAGKTTMLRAISGTLGLNGGRITGGDIVFNGTSMIGKGAGRIVREGIVQVPEGRRIFARCTVQENLRAGGITAPGKAARRAAADWVFDLFPRLAERSGQRAGLLSGGEQQMLAIGRALMACPQLLLLDEPSLGLAPIMVNRIQDVVREINRQGTSVMLIEQNASMALGVSTHGFVLDVGKVAFSAPAAELIGSDVIQRLYLGDSGATGEAAHELRHEPMTIGRWQG